MLRRLDGIVMLMVVTMSITHLHGRHGRKINGKDTATQIEPSKCQLFLRPYLKPDFNCSLKFFCSQNPNLKVCGLSLDILNRTADKVEGTVRLYLL